MTHRHDHLPLSRRLVGAALLLAGSAVAGFAEPALSTAPLVPAAAQESALPEAPPAEEPVVQLRPRWLERAEKSFAEGVRAREAGDARAAQRRFSQALKILADNGDQALLGLQDQVEALFTAAEEQLSPAPPPETGEAPPPATLTVTPEELSQAAPAPAPPAAPKGPEHSMPIDPDDPLVKKYMSLYTTRYRANLQAAFNRMALHREMIQREIKALGLPRELVYLPLVESEYQVRAVSRAGAVGLWQFMTVTGRNSGLKINYWVDERLDVEKATKAALRHLKDLHNWFQSWPFALAAYNRGLYGLQRDIEFTRSPDFSSVAGRGGLPSETEQYVPKFMAVTLIGDNAEAYGFTLPPAQIAPAVDRISLDKPLDLKIAAQCAGSTEDDLRVLNPVLRLWCTPKDQQDFQLVLPKGAAKKAQECLAGIKDWTPSTGVVKHRVKQGEILGKIASRYRTTVAAIMRDNRIVSAKRLRPGQVLVIRPGRGYRGS